MSTSRLPICAAFLAAFGWGIPAAHATLTPANFSGWSAIPNGTFNSAPAVATWGPSTLIAAGRGMDDQIYTNTMSAGSWQASWTGRGGTFLSSPSLATWGSTGLVIVGLGTDNHIYVDATSPTNVHTGWNGIAAKTLFSDVAVAYVSPRLYVTGRGSDGNAYFAVNNLTSGYTNAGWSAWTVIPNGAVYSAPAMFGTTGNLRVIERGGSGSNGARFFVNTGSMATPSNPFDNGTTTTTWSLSGVGTFNSAMSISGWGTGHVDAFGLGTDNFIWAESSESGTWGSGAIQLPGRLMASHPASCSWGTGHINVLARGTDDVFYMNTYQD